MSEIEPATRALIQMMAGLELPKPEAIGAVAYRATIPAPASDPADDAAIASATDVDAGGVAARLYQPLGTPTGLAVYFHGGGFVVGSIASCDASVRAISARTGLAILSVDYRLAPEQPFPAAVDDAMTALRWAASDLATASPADMPLLVGGESAGANLAAVAAILARDEGVALAYQFLFYPVVDCDFERNSYVQHAAQLPLSGATMRWFWDCYASAHDRGDWRACPLRAPSLRDVAPAYIAVAGHDPLRDEGVAYADRLRREGVAVILDEHGGLVHGFVAMRTASPSAKAALDQACAAIRVALAIA